MINSLIKFVLQSDLAKFFIVGFFIGVLNTASGYFSFVLWAAVILSILAPLTALKFFDDKLTYDQKQQVITTALLFSSFLWAVYLWKDLQDYPAVLILTYVSLTVASLLLFNDLKQRLILLSPITLSFLFFTLVVTTPAEYFIGFSAVMILAVFLFYGTLTVGNSPQKDSTLTELETSDKLEYIAEIDEQKTQIQELQEKIKQVEINLSAAEMAKMEFLATMSHEIRTPLNGIIPLLDILLDSELSDFQRDYLSTAHVSAIQMQKLIDDLLDYSKVEAGKLTVETRGLKVLRIMSAVNTSYQQAAQKKNLTIELDVNSNVSPLLRGDPTRLRQVLSNLLSNAIKFSKKGTIKLTAKKIKNSPTKEIIRFEVIDQGIGLDKETSANIFLPFTQEDGSSTRKFGGTGLGLAISKKIVDLMHGSIYVESEKGRGSNFYFDLPLLKSMGETSVGITEKSGYQAILVNTNPLLFNKISQKLKSENVPFQKALGLSQAYEMFSSINKVSKATKQVLVFIDFETAGKQVRSLCNDLVGDKALTNLYACILSDTGKIAGIPNHSNVKIVAKNDSMAELLNKIEVLQASNEAQRQAISESQAIDFDKNKPSPEESEKTEKHREQLIPEILLVEDNEVNLKVAEKLIQYIGYPFDFAMNGQEALEKVKENRYRMILMDCQMPVMDGYRCTSKIRDYETAAGLNRTPILAMTANAMMGDREKCIDAGMDDYMSKPLNRYILEKTLKKWDPLVNNGSNGDAKTEDKPVTNQAEDLVKPRVEKNQAIGSKTTNISPIKSQKETATNSQVVINQKWLSTKSLEEIKEFMGDEMIQLLEMYQQETPSIIAKMKAALQNNNLDEVQKMAHMLKSTSANIGANGLSFFSRKMELAAKKANRKELIVTFNKTQKAYVLTSKEIIKYMTIS